MVWFALLYVALLVYIGWRSVRSSARQPDYFPRRRGFGASGASSRCSRGTTFYEGWFVKTPVVGTILWCTAAPARRGHVRVCLLTSSSSSSSSCRRLRADAAALGHGPGARGAGALPSIRARCWPVARIRDTISVMRARRASSRGWSPLSNRERAVPCDSPGGSTDAPAQPSVSVVPLPPSRAA